MWILSSRGFRKCGTFGVYDFLKGSYWLSKFSHFSIFFNSKMRCCKKKTRPQFWFFGLATESVWVPPCGAHADSVASPKNQNCGRVFFLQHLLILLTDPKFQSLLTLSSNNSPLETPTPKKYDIFGILRTWASTWWYPGFGYQYQKLE